MNKDVYGLLLALAGLLIVWLWATGRIENTWAAIQGTGAAQATTPATEQGVSAGSQPSATSGRLPTDTQGTGFAGLYTPSPYGGAGTYNTVADALLQIGQMQVPVNLPGVQTTVGMPVNQTPAVMTLLPPQYVDPLTGYFGSHGDLGAPAGGIGSYLPFPGAGAVNSVPQVGL